MNYERERIEPMAAECLQCEGKEISEGLSVAERRLCAGCAAAFETAVRREAAETYQALQRTVTTADGRCCSKPFEAYVAAKRAEALIELYERRALGPTRRGGVRREMLRLLPATIDKDELARRKREAVCALTGAAKRVTVDHFIPLEWGHGGETEANVYFVRQDLNALKSNKNPFRWYNQLTQRSDFDAARWDRLIRELAARNGLDAREYRRYVHWCEKNKRTKEQLLADDCSSLELWRAYGSP
ncbi:hypothetical protein MO973_02725 [Paenibacillus sp. TRM 82003]|nr:hypothetical protein [Paenibacillus sp. TRM 82003]